MPEALWFTDDEEACRLLAEDPFALLVGFALDQQVTVLNARVDLLARESRHLEVEMVCVLVLNHVDRRHHVSGGSIQLPEPTYRAGIKHPAPPGPSVFKPDFHLRSPSGPCRNTYLLGYGAAPLVSSFL